MLGWGAEQLVERLSRGYEVFGAILNTKSNGVWQYMPGSPVLDR